MNSVKNSFKFSVIFSHFQSFSVIFSHFQSFSIIFSHFQSFSVIIILVFCHFTTFYKKNKQNNFFFFFFSRFFWKTGRVYVIKCLFQYIYYNK